MAITRETTIPKQQQPNNDNNNTTESTTPTTVSRYEQTREQRIKENRERLQKLGIVDLSLQLKSISSTASRRNPRSQFDRKTPLKSLALVPSEPSRRSSRLQSAPPISYIEPKEDKSRRRRRDIVLEVGSKPEYYTEEHDKLLGNTEMPWTFFVDGYAADGRRIYDPVNGKTCHQCRQKTLGQRTRCSQCSLVQGQFCGDCLYMRYGEHVVEANQNPNWICPPCRGICNCSLCRQAKGWPPTGSLYRRISDLGYKSVAHYLVATKRAPPEVDTNPDTEQSTKLCLPFEGMEVPSDVADEKGTDSKTEPSQIPEGVRRSGRKSKKENTSDGRELAIISVVAEDQPVCEMESPKRVGRPRKKSKSENIDGGEESVSKDIIENGTDAEMKSPKRVGRPRKQTPEGVRRSGWTSKKEHASDGRELAIISVVAEDQPVREMESPKRVGKPRKKSKSENIDGGEELVSKDIIEYGTDAEMKSPKRVGRPRKQTPEGVRRSGRMSKKEHASDGQELAIISVVAEDQLVREMESPKRVGRPWKKSKSENIYGGEELVSKDIIENGTDAEMKSPKRVGRPRKQTPEGVRRSGRTSKKEHTSDGRELAIISVVAEDQSVCEMESPKRVGRPRKKSKSENIDSDEESVSKDVIENGTDAEMKSLKRVGRPRKQSKKEIIDGGVETVSKDVIENGSDSKMKSPKAVGRPRKTPAKENIDGGVESQSKDVAENGVDFEMKNRDISSPMTDSVARSLRPRNKNCISSS